MAIFRSWTLVKNKAASSSACGASGQCVFVHSVNKHVYLWKSNRHSLNTHVCSALHSNLFFREQRCQVGFFTWPTLLHTSGNLCEVPLLYASRAPWASLMLIVALPILCACLFIHVPHQMVWEERLCLPGSHLSAWHSTWTIIKSQLLFIEWIKERCRKHLTMMQCYMNVIHSSKDYLESTVCRPCASGTCPPTHLIMAITGFIHTVPSADGFLYKQGVHEQDSTVAHSSQAAAFTFALELPRQRLPTISQFPSLVGNFLFYSAENLIWPVKYLHIGRALALLLASSWHPY